MNLSNQKRISAKLMKVGKKRVWFDSNRLDEIKEHMSSGIFPDLAARVWQDKGLREACVKKLVEIISAVPDIDGQRQLREQLGSQGEVTVCQMLAKAWSL